MLIGVGVTLILRLAAIRWKLRLPVFQPKEANAEFTSSAPKESEESETFLTRR
jgi:hypothetical protein